MQQGRIQPGNGSSGLPVGCKCARDHQRAVMAGKIENTSV